MHFRHGLSFTLFATAACVGDGTSTSQDAATLEDGASETSAGDAAVAGDASADAGASDAIDEATLFNGCSPQDFTDNDQTAATSPRVITFPTDATPGPYSPRCMMVKRHQAITFKGNFTAHPIVGFNVDNGAPNPIDMMTPSNGQAVTGFFTAGTYGYKCSVHGPPLMWGAIAVVP